MNTTLNSMSNKKSCTFFIIFLLIFTIQETEVFAQSEAGVIFLLLSPSSQANAMGQTYGNIAATSPMAAIFNPASLGLFAQKNYFGYSYYPDKIPWLTGLTSNVNLSARTISFGINLNNSFHIPVSLGLASHKFRINFGNLNIPFPTSPDFINNFASYDKVNGTTFSIALDYYIRASFGYTFKSVESRLAPGEFGKADINAHDLGFILQFPVYKLLTKFDVVQKQFSGNIVPYFDPGFYWSKTNIGGKIKYLTAAQADPLPRNLSLGINLNTGLVYTGKQNSFNLISYKWAREVDDMLIKVENNFTRNYVSGLNDIKFWDNLVFGKSNDKIIKKSGQEFNFGDFYFIRSGHYEDLGGKVIIDTEGWGINYTQLFKILTALFDLEDNQILRLISNINFEEHHSEYNANMGHPLYGVKFKSYIFRVSNFSLN